MGDSADIDALRARIIALETENAQLRGVPDAARPAPRGRWRAWVSALCLVLAAVLVPVSTVSGWARTQLVSEDAFVATFAPLADDSAVQALVIDEATAAIIAAVDVDGLTNDLFDGLGALDLPPAAQSALALLRGPAAAGVQSLIGAGVAAAVHSDAFPQLWRTTLAASHRALVAVVSSDPDGIVAVSADGELGIQLAPVIEAVRAQLVANGFAFAGSIPTIDVTIVVAQSDALPTVALVYGLAVGVGAWLPLVALLLFATGIAVARHRRVAILGAGIGAAIGGFALAIALAGGLTASALAATSLGVPRDAIAAVYLGLTGAMNDTAIVLGVIGLVVAVMAWLFSGARAAVVIRTVTGNATSSVRGWLVSQGLRTGRFGRILDRYAALAQGAIAVGAVLVLFALRPVSLATVVVTGLIALLLWLAVALLRTDADAALTASTDPAARRD